MAIDKRDLCEEIGSFFGNFYISIHGKLVIDDGETEHFYDTEDELLKDWISTLKEADEDTGDDFWSEVIEYIEDLD